MNRFVLQLGGAAVVVLFAALAVGVYFNQAGMGLRPGSEASPSPSPSAESTQPAPTESTPAETPTAEPTPAVTPESTAEPPTTPASVLYSWNSQSALEDWPAPLRVEIPGAGVETTNGVSYSDPMGDTAPGDVSAVDLTAVRAFLGCQAGLPKLRCIEMDLAGNLQDPRPLPEEAWYGWGIVLDVDSDGIPDYRYGVDNSDPGVGPFDGGQRVRGRIWRADLHTGNVEVVAVSQGSDDTLLGELPGTDGFPAIFHIKGLSGLFYAWSSLIQDGHVVASDYAPNNGWLELVNK